MFVFELMDNLIDPFNPDYCLSFFVSKQKFISEVEILFSGYYSYFKSSFIVDIHELLINKQNNIKSLFIYPSSNRTYSNLRLIIGKYYYLTINNFHKYLINNIEFNIYCEVIPFDQLIKSHSILHNNNLLLYPTQYLTLQTKDYLSPNINIAKLIYSKIIKNQITSEYVKSLNDIEYQILFKFAIHKNRLDIIELLKQDDKVKGIVNILKHLMKVNISLFKSFDNLEYYLDDNGFNLLECAIIDKNIEGIMILKNLHFDRSSYYVECSYGTNYLDYSANNELIDDKNIPKRISNCKFINSLIIDQMLHSGYFDSTYDYIIHHLKHFDYSLLCDMLIRNGARLTAKLLVSNGKIELNKHVVIMLIKMQLEDLNNIEQKEVFLNNSESILNLMINDCKIWERFKEKGYLKLLNHNFIINKEGDNILHLLVKNKYQEFHNQILQYVYGINKEVINNVNCCNENCIFEMINKRIINEIFIYGVENKQNINGDYFIHKVIRNNDFNLLFSTLSISNQMINLKTNYNETPIILAAKLKNVKMVNYLNKMKCKMDCVDEFGNSCYHYVALNNLKVDFNIDRTIINKFNNKSIDYMINHIITEY